MAAQDQEKALADTEPLSGDFESMGTQKVQLDIDDAPFLDEPEETPPPPPAPVEKPEEKTPEEEKPKSRKKKLIIIGGGAVVLLAVVGAVLKFVVFAEPKIPEPTAPIIIVTQPTPAGPTGPQTQMMELSKFIVELKDIQGKRYFLNASFTLDSANTMAIMEAQDKLIIIRDAIFYYLSTQDYEFLRNPANNDLIQTSLLDAVNEILVQGKIDRILFAEFLIR